MDIRQLHTQLINGNRRALARAITLVENDAEGASDLLSSIEIKSVPVTGITGPPGAGKSTLINGLIAEFLKSGNCKNGIAVVSVDPTSPFTHGSLLGDRLRMNEHFNNPDVFIRSLATRGALGGLSAKSQQVLDIIKAAGFDHILLETVGVGQSEVEVISLADTTVVVLVPEAGDEIQALKSGIMEIGDIFVVNKSDRDGAAKFIAGLQKTLHERPASDWIIPVIKTIATEHSGITELMNAILQHPSHISQERKIFFEAEKLYRLIQQEKMKGITTESLLNIIKRNSDKNIYLLSREIAGT